MTCLAMLHTSSSPTPPWRVTHGHTCYSRCMVIAVLACAAPSTHRHVSLKAIRGTALVALLSGHALHALRPHNAAATARCGSIYDVYRKPIFSNWCHTCMASVVRTRKPMRCASPALAGRYVRTAAMKRSAHAAPAAYVRQGLATSVVRVPHNRRLPFTSHGHTGRQTDKQQPLHVLLGQVVRIAPPPPPPHTTNDHTAKLAETNTTAGNNTIRARRRRRRGRHAAPALDPRALACARPLPSPSLPGPLTGRC